MHYGALSDRALTLLGQLYSAVEAAGTFPPSINATSYVLIPKATGGQRPIGLLASAYRLWAKARARVWASRRNAHERPVRSAGRLKSARLTQKKGRSS